MAENITLTQINEVLFCLKNENGIGITCTATTNPRENLTRPTPPTMIADSAQLPSQQLLN